MLGSDASRLCKLAHTCGKFNCNYVGAVLGSLKANNYYIMHKNINYSDTRTQLNEKLLQQ